MRKKRICLVTFYDLHAFGVRILASIAQQQNIDVHIIYLKEFQYAVAPKWNTKSHGYDFLRNAKKYSSNPSSISEDEKKIFFDLVCEIDPDLILLSTRTFGLEIAREMISSIKEVFKGKVMAGGWGPTLQAEKFLEFCDYVCFGEGEKSIEQICEVLKRGECDFKQIKNLSYKSNEKVVVNPLFEPLTDEEYERYCEYSMDPFYNSYLIDNNNIYRNCFEKKDSPSYVLTARGCPLQCSYCMSSKYHEIYKNRGYSCKKYRVRSVDSVMKELTILKERGAKHIMFVDEIFPFNKQWLEEFLPRYKSEIGFPFFGYIRPEFHKLNTVKDIIDAGLMMTTLGIQSGSEFMLKKVYKRFFKKEDIPIFASFLQEKGIQIKVDLLSHCAFEEEKDLKDTFNFVCQLPYVDVSVFRINIFPGSPLDHMLKEKNPKPLPDNISSWYSVLYSMAIISPVSRKIAIFFHAKRLFINNPDILIRFYTLKHVVWDRIRKWKRLLVGKKQ